MGDACAARACNLVATGHPALAGSPCSNLNSAMEAGCTSAAAAVALSDSSVAAPLHVSAQSKPSWADHEYV